MGVVQHSDPEEHVRGPSLPLRLSLYIVWDLSKPLFLNFRYECAWKLEVCRGKKKNENKPSKSRKAAQSFEAAAWGGNDSFVSRQKRSWGLEGLRVSSEEL